MSKNIVNPIIMSIEGNIGSGKSTLLAMLKVNISNKKICFIQEPINVWSEVKDNNDITILEHFYKDQNKYAFTFQMMAYITRLTTLKREIEKNEYDIIITERSIFTDKNVFAKMLYDDKKLDDIQYNIYMKWFNEFINDIPEIKFIYISTDPIVAYNRIKKRNREGENNISYEYIKHCNDYHEEWLQNNKYVEKKINNNNEDIFNQIMELKEIVKKFLK